MSGRAMRQKSPQPQPQAHLTDVVLSALCPPRRWSDAGVGVNTLRGAGGSPYLKIENCWGFPDLKMEKFVGFTTLPFHVFDRYEIHMQYLRDSIYAFVYHFPIFIFATCYKIYILEK